MNARTVDGLLERLRWPQPTTADLAAWGVPCVCGEDPRPGHGDGLDEGSGLPDCPGQYEPDTERVCPDCGGAGGWDDCTGDDCQACAGTGVRP